MLHFQREISFTPCPFDRTMACWDAIVIQSTTPDHTIFSKSLRLFHFVVEGQGFQSEYATNRKVVIEDIMFYRCWKWSVISILDNKPDKLTVIWAWFMNLKKAHRFDAWYSINENSFMADQWYEIEYVGKVSCDNGSTDKGEMIFWFRPFCTKKTLF
jgi:hypothetical protein